MLAELLGARAAATPDAVAFVAGAATLSFASWDRRSDAVATELVRRGVGPADRVVLRFDADDFLAFVVAAAGVHKAGAVMIPLAAHASVVEHDRIVRHSGAVAALGVAALAEMEEEGGGPAVAPPSHAGPGPVEVSYRLRPLSRAQSTPHRAEDILSLLDALDSVHTGVPVTSMLHASAVGTDPARWALWFPLRPGRGPVVTVAGADPERICALSAARRVSRWVLDPLVAALVLDAGAADGHDLSSLGQIILTGGRSRPAGLSRLAARFPGASIVSVGSTADGESARTAIPYDPRRELPDGEVGPLDAPPPRPPSVAPRDDLERVVAGAWERVLAREAVGVHDDFFELGGDGLAAVEVLSLVEDALGAAVEVAEFLEAPTVAELTARAAVLVGEGAASDPPVAPVAASQEGMLWQEQLVPGSQNLPPLARRYRGPLDLDVLGRVLTEIVRRHEPLRTTFALRRGKPVQVVAPPGALALRLDDLSGQPADEQADQVARFLAEARRPLDLVEGPLFEATVFRLATEDHVLVLRVHHSVYDDWSVGVFRRELSALYTAFATGKPSPLPEPPVTFRDFAQGQRRRLAGEAGARELAWWRRHLTGAPLALQLPVGDPADPPGTPQASPQPVSVALPAEVHAQLQALARRERTTVFTTALAAVAALLGRHTGQTELLLASVVANRNRVELEDMVGCFTKKVLLRVDLAGAPTFAELVARARAALLGALSHQDLPFETVLQEVLGPAAAASGLVPQAAVMFQGVTPPPGDVALPGLTTEGYDTSSTTRRAHFAAAGDDEDAPEAASPWGAGIYLGTFVILSVVQDGDDLSFVARGAYWRPGVERLLGHLCAVLAAAVAHPSRPVSELAQDAHDVAPTSDAPATTLRGFPVDSSRIEAVLARHPAVRRVTVTLEEAEPGDAHLVAHVLPEGDEPPTLAELRVHLWRELPGYAWPRALVVTNGSGGETGAPPAPPTPEECFLARLWADVLGVEEVPVDANYWQRFSFLEAVARAREAGVRLGDAQVARNRTIVGLAADLAAERERAGRD